MNSTKYDDYDILSLLREKGLDKVESGWLERIEAVRCDQVERALTEPAGFYRFERLLALISPAAEGYLEEMARQARRLTWQRFGRTIRLYAPLYLSNRCINSCLYCGFNCTSEFRRTRLTVDEAVAEAEIIASEGFRDLLLVSSEDREWVSVDYLSELARRLREMFSSLAIEIYQMEQDDYAALFGSGIEGVTIYQETYQREIYRRFHPAGPKADYERRLIGPDSIAGAGMREIGLGALLGLANWQLETLALAEHAHYLMKRYWQSHVSFSFPRLRPAFEVGRSQFEHLMSDTQLVQMILALRLCFADAGLVLSTRESPRLRDRLVKLGITKMSAGSRTNPGGYSGHEEAVKQFEVDDTRTPGEVARMLRGQGLEPVWKDWDCGYIEETPAAK